MSVFVIFAIVLRVVVNPLANVFQKQLTQQTISPFYINFTTYFLLSIATFFLIPYLDFSVVSYEFLFYAFTAGALGAMGNGLLVKAFEKGDLSVLGPINSYKSIVGLIFGIIILSEMPNVWGLLGMILIVFGSYFVLDTTEERFSWKIFKNREVQYRLGAMIISAIEAIFIKKTILLSSVSLSFVSWCWIGALFAYIILKVLKVDGNLEVKKIDSSSGMKFAALVLCIGLMQYTTNYVFENMVVGYALAIFQLSTILSILFGYTIFKETDIRKKMIGSVVMIAGSVIIILLN